MILVEEYEGEQLWISAELTEQEQAEISESLWLNPQLVTDEEVAGFWGSVSDCE